jgi:hypothetical protein
MTTRIGVVFAEFSSHQRKYMLESISLFQERFPSVVFVVGDEKEIKGIKDLDAVLMASEEGVPTLSEPLREHLAAVSLLVPTPMKVYVAGSTFPSFPKELLKESVALSKGLPYTDASWYRKFVKQPDANYQTRAPYDTHFARRNHQFPRYF